MPGEDFLKKLENIQQYYQLDPEINHEQFGLFKNFLDYFTIEDLEILIHSYIQKHEGDPLYNLKNLKAIENKHHLEELAKYLGSIGKLEASGDIKLLLKIKKGEPAHYDPNWGVHVIPVYLRYENNMLSIFILDQAAGIICETRDGFVNMISVLEAYAKQFYGENYRIIKSSGINQKDARNCPIYSLSALHYYVKKGHEFFNAINDFLVPQDQKVYDRENNKIFHLKADGLPAPLVKMSNKRTLERVNAAYAHAWMPVKVQLTAAYANNPADLIAHALEDLVGKHPRKNLARYLDLHAEPRQNSSGESYVHNTAADEKMGKARKTILWSLRMSGTLESFKNITKNDLVLVDQFFEKIKKTRPAS